MNASPAAVPARADLHTHTALCKHASGLPREYLAAAQSAGLAYLGVSDHFPAPAGYDAEFRMAPSDLPRYFEILRSLREEAAGGPVQILAAAEFDYVPGRMDEVFDALAPVRSEFDYLLGSVHYVGDFAFDDPGKLDEWPRFGVDAVWDVYLNDLDAFVGLGGFNVLAHSDLPKKFGFRPTDYESAVRRMSEIYRKAAAKGICLELNTAGLRVPADEIYPALPLLRAAFEAGMQITLGSDAHKPEHVAYAFDRAAALARSVGWTTHTAFVRGEPLALPL
ncbi:MAG: histidinol-phosphatase HisJ family protein [Lentisphaeria bacterium]|nr:histidinol-phosphatase HisJ family protein [Lentisphaeria bacterium]